MLDNATFFGGFSFFFRSRFVDIYIFQKFDSSASLLPSFFFLLDSRLSKKKKRKKLHRQQHNVLSSKSKVLHSLLKLLPLVLAFHAREKERHGCVSFFPSTFSSTKKTSSSSSSKNKNGTKRVHALASSALFFLVVVLVALFFGEGFKEKRWRVPTAIFINKNASSATKNAKAFIQNDFVPELTCGAKVGKHQRGVFTRSVDRVEQSDVL